MWGSVWFSCIVHGSEFTMEQQVASNRGYWYNGGYCSCLCLCLAKWPNRGGVGGTKAGEGTEGKLVKGCEGTGAHWVVECVCMCTKRIKGGRRSGGREG